MRFVQQQQSPFSNITPLSPQIDMAFYCKHSKTHECVVVKNISANIADSSKRVGFELFGDFCAVAAIADSVEKGASTCYTLLLFHGNECQADSFDRLYLDCTNEISRQEPQRIPIIPFRCLCACSLVLVAVVTQM